jgi:hypothetical protein
MGLINLIINTNTLVWVIIPFRQYKTRFFGYFLILAVLDLAYIVLKNFIQINTLYYYLYGTILLLYPALLEIKHNYKIGILIVLGITGSFVLYNSPIDSILVQVVIHLIIFINFLKLLIIHYSQARKLKIFHLMLIIYEFSVILKFFVYYKEIGIGPVYYFLTTAFEILIGLFFIFINEKNSPEFSI